MSVGDWFRRYGAAVKRFVKKKFKQEWLILRLEGSALGRIFIPTYHNTWTKSVGTIILLVIWGTVYLATALGFVEEQPPFFVEFTLLQFMILGRWWGVELVYQSLAEIEAETRAGSPSRGRGHHADREVESDRQRD